MKKLLCIVCALALAALSGCALAKADSVDPGAEILVGAFVTAESLSKPWNNTAIELTRTEKGWEFPNVEGIWVYQIPVYENGRLSFEISEDPRADLGGITARVGGGVSWSATLTLANTIDPDTALHFNPLYLRQDGTMYTVADIGLGVDPELVGQGGASTEVVQQIDTDSRDTTNTDECHLRHFHIYHTQVVQGSNHYRTTYQQPPSPIGKGVLESVTDC